MKEFVLKYKINFIVVVILFSITSVLNVSVAWLLQLIVDSATSGVMSNFVRSVLLFVAFLVVSYFIELITLLARAKYIKKTLIYFKSCIMKGILNKDIASFSENNTGTYISVLNNDLSIIENDYLTQIFYMISYVVRFILAFASLMYINIYITLIVIVLSLVAFFLPQCFSQKLSKSKMFFSQKSEAFIAKIKDLLLGFEVVKNFNIESRTQKEFDDSNIELESSKEKFAILSGLFDSFGGLLSTMIVMGPIVAGGYLVIKGQVSVGTLIALIQLINSVSYPIINGIQGMNKIKSTKEIRAKVCKIINSNETNRNIEYKQLDEFKDKIVFDNVVFGYDKSKTILKGVNAEFEKGKKYAIIGESGSGKSTIIRLIQKYYENYSGEISVDNINLSNISSENLYKLTSIIHQNVFMFPGSIKDNVTLYNDYSDEEVMKVIKMAGLEKLVNSLPKGIYEDVGENGNKLSGGEKQRISICRALIKKSSILLLDESTSALDNITSYEIEKSLLRIDNLTTIVITHKLSEEILKNYDEIYVLKNGKIIEKDSFYNLIDKKGYFYSMYALNNVEDDNVKIS